MTSQLGSARGAPARAIVEIFPNCLMLGEMTIERLFQIVAASHKERQRLVCSYICRVY